MLRALGFVPALLAVVAWGSSLAFATGSHPCGPRGGAQTLASNHEARVYLVVTGPGAGGVYGCTAHHTYRLGGGHDHFHEHVGHVALAGTVVAYGLLTSGVDTEAESVIVRRLTDGHRLRELSATTRPLGPEFVQSVDSIVVRTDGAVAWVCSAASIGSLHHRDIEVVKADARGEVLLDSGTEIRPRSLALNDSTLTWRHGTHTRSARVY